MTTNIIIEKDGSKIYYLDHLYHREDGPAKEYADGDKRWYLHGKFYPEEKCWRLVKLKCLW